MITPTPAQQAKIDQEIAEYHGHITELIKHHEQLAEESGPEQATVA